VVIIYQENHSFDNVLGKLCVLDDRCNGATSGKLPDGQVIPLRRASDIVEKVEHLSGGQRTAIDDGRMDGFSRSEAAGPPTTTSATPSTTRARFRTCRPWRGTSTSATEPFR
jgi:hypothetical protein